VLRPCLRPWLWPQAGVSFIGSEALRLGPWPRQVTAPVSKSPPTESRSDPYRAAAPKRLSCPSEHEVLFVGDGGYRLSG
jgi:hypothetical protein